MTCRVCKESKLKPCFTWSDFPIYIWPIQKKINQEFRDLKIFWCSNCGLVQLDIFDNDFIKKLYSEEAFGLVSATEFKTSSKNNNNFLRYCSENLGPKWSNSKKILDIGGYDVLTCHDLDYAEAVICDPNAPDFIEKKNLTVIKNFFSKELFEKKHFDIIIAKHVLEHINDITLFMKSLKSVLKDNGKLILEIPNQIDNILKNGLYENFYHQHLMYFDTLSIENLLNMYGFKIFKKYNDGSIIRIIAHNGKTRSDIIKYQKNKMVYNNLLLYKKKVDSFLIGFDSFITKNSEKKIIFFGAGGSTTILLYLVKNLRNHIELIIDSSKNKFGKKVSDTNFIVESPDVLEIYQDRNILINSEMFFNDILESLRNKHSNQGFQILDIFSDMIKFTL